MIFVLSEKFATGTSNTSVHLSENALIERHQDIRFSRDVATCQARINDCCLVFEGPCCAAGWRRLTTHLIATKRAVHVPPQLIGLGNVGALLRKVVFDWMLKEAASFACCPTTCG